MKLLSNWIMIMLAASCLVVVQAGCKKQEQPSEWKTQGTRVSLSELRDAFEKATDKDIQAWVSDAATSLHYGQYANALAALDKLANHPSSTAQQKKVTSKVIGQVKQLAANSRAVPGS